MRGRFLKRMVKIDATEVKISGLLVLRMGHIPKLLDPTLPAQAFCQRSQTEIIV